MTSYFHSSPPGGAAGYDSAASRIDPSASAAAVRTPRGPIPHFSLKPPPPLPPRRRPPARGGGGGGGGRPRRGRPGRWGGREPGAGPERLGGGRRGDPLGRRGARGWAPPPPAVLARHRQAEAQVRQPV